MDDDYWQWSRGSLSTALLRNPLCNEYFVEPQKRKLLLSITYNLQL
jgi:hypothetical protein